MIENLNDFISLVVIAAVTLLSLVASIRVFMTSDKKDDDEEFFREIL
ncbi:MAG: hypothetical protein GX753_00510 [Erysipelothrix sp.]|nr:hypothetical protein [Erysipelothrix sp.]